MKERLWCTGLLQHLLASPPRWSFQSHVFSRCSTRSWSCSSLPYCFSMGHVRQQTEEQTRNLRLALACQVHVNNRPRTKHCVSVGIHRALLSNSHVVFRDDALYKVDLSNVIHCRPSWQRLRVLETPWNRLGVVDCARSVHYDNDLGSRASPEETDPEGSTSIEELSGIGTPCSEKRRTLIQNVRLSMCSFRWPTPRVRVSRTAGRCLVHWKMS